MKTVSESLLRAKHWQIFLTFVVLLCTGIAAIVHSMGSSTQNPFAKILPFFAVMELLAVSFALWLWTVGVFLGSVVDSTFRMKLTFFRVSVLFLPLYIPIFEVCFQNLGRDVRLTLILFAVIFPLHLFALFCQVYSWYFVSKSLALAESPHFASFPDYVGFFFGLWFFPIGLWIIQPRINRIYAGTLGPRAA